MGNRYLKAEEEAIRELYPTATQFEIRSRIPDRTWAEIGVKARKMGIHRTTEAKGDSIREGRVLLKNAYSFTDNYLFDRLFPIKTHAELLAAFPGRSFKALISHAQRRHLHRTKEAKARQVQIGREEVKRKLSEEK
jgi:hypothetical protein